MKKLILIFVLCSGCSFIDDLLDKDKEELALQPPPVVEPPPSPYSTRIISRFLWKPEGEHTKKIVILVDPEDIRAVIKGSKGEERLAEPYPTNGYGSTIRGKQPGCWYGKDIKVYFYDKQQGDKPVKTKMGADFKGVDNGCKRIYQDNRERPDINKLNLEDEEAIVND